jgi:hypothetical protein
LRVRLELLPPRHQPSSCILIGKKAAWVPALTRTSSQPSMQPAVGGLEFAVLSRAWRICKPRSGQLLVVASTRFSCAYWRMSDTTTLVLFFLARPSSHVHPRIATGELCAHLHMSRTNISRLCLSQAAGRTANEAAGCGRISNIKCPGRRRMALLASDARIHISTSI